MPLDPIKLPEHHDNTLADCDAALGLYMRAWNQLEMAMAGLFHKLADTNIVTSDIIITAINDQRTIRGILEALGKQRLEETAHAGLLRLIARAEGAAAIRNRLVHGTWQLNLTMGTTPRQAERAEWVRFYPPTDPQVYHKLAGKSPDQKLLSKHQFRLGRIAQIANEVDGLSRDFRAFTEAATLLPAGVPQPVF